MDGSAEHSSLPSLSPDDWRRVFSWLGWRDLCTCSCVCHDWHSLASDDALWQQQTRAAYHRPQVLPTLKLLAGSTAGGQQQPQQPPEQSGPPPAPAPLKQAFAQHLALPAASHQALLARFHAAMQHITGWRLLISLTDPAAGPQPAASGEGAADAAAGPPAATPEQQQHQQRQLTGHPLPLTLPGLTASAGWCVGCAMQQAQEQSVWVRFYLPPGLQEDEQVQAAAAAGRLRAAVQALGPAGWFDVACCRPFKMQQDDMLILLQSHQSGFYAWDAADTAAEGEDRFENSACEPLPWDLPAGSQQQQPQQPPQQPQQQQPQQPQQPPQQPQQQPQQQQPQEQQQPQPPPPPPPQQQQQQPPQQPVKLRMLVYIHYEQLLQCLPPAFSALALPGARPAPPRLARQPVLLPLHRLPLRVLWLHLDVCQLHGGFRVGTCVAPLLLARIGNDSVVLEASPQSVLAALVRPDSAASSSGSSSPAGDGLADEFQVLAVGKRMLVGAGQGRSSEGLLLQSASDVLLDLITRDEVMVDFSLFDEQGQLLVGRAGVEIWSKECTSLFNAPQQQDEQQEQQQQAAAHAGPLFNAAAAAVAPADDDDEFTDSSSEEEWHVVGPDVPPAGAVVPVSHTRQVQMLHFLVDDVDESLWANGLCVDAMAAPPHACTVPLLRMRLTLPALRGLFKEAADLEADDIMQLLLD